MCKREERPLFQGVTYSMEEENPDQAVFLNDRKIPGDLGEERRALVGGEVPLSLAAVPELSGGRPHCGRAHHITTLLRSNHQLSELGPAPSTPVSSRQRDRGTDWWEAWR